MLRLRSSTGNPTRKPNIHLRTLTLTVFGLALFVAGPAAQQRPQVPLAGAAGTVVVDSGMKQLQRDLSTLSVPDRQSLIGIFQVTGASAFIEQLGIITAGFGISLTLFVSPSTCQIQTYYVFKEAFSGRRVQQNKKTTSSGTTRNLVFPLARFTGNAALFVNSVTGAQCSIAFISPQLR